LGNIVDKQSENTKKDKFVLLVEKRVNRALKSIQVIGNLSNRSLYDYSDEDVRQITKALEDEIKELKRRYESPKKDREPGFRLR